MECLYNTVNSKLSQWSFALTIVVLNLITKCINFIEEVIEYIFFKMFYSFTCIIQLLSLILGISGGLLQLT